MKQTKTLWIVLLSLNFMNSRAQMKVYSTGKIAFGSTASTPNYNLDVKAGDININDATSTNGYRLGQTMVLWQNNVGTCIFAGPE